MTEALAAFGLSGCRAELIRHNENETWHVRAPGGSDVCVLRVRRPREGFSLGVLGMEDAQEALLEGETQLLFALHSAGFPCQRPLPSASGGFVARLADGTFATALSWLPGETLEAGYSPANLEAVGRMAARLHRFLREWRELSSIERYRYDGALLRRAAESLERARDGGAIPPDVCAAMLRACRVVAARIADLPPGYAHADLSKSNLLLHLGAVSPIDFSLSGFAPFEMDLGFLFASFDKPAEQCAIQAGYESEAGAKIDRRDIEPFFALSVLLFIASQHARAAEWSDWFPRALQRWRATIFEPLASGKPLFYR